MVPWSGFSSTSGELAAAAARLMDRHDVAFLATASAAGRPRLHPFVPRVVDGRMVAFIVDRSPKYRDLIERRQYAIHLMPGDEDEQFFFSGEADYVDDDAAFRQKAAGAMGFFTDIDAGEKLFEFRLDRALWTRWLDFGTKDHRPKHLRWRASAQDGVT